LVQSIESLVVIIRFNKFNNPKGVPNSSRIPAINPRILVKELKLFVEPVFILEQASSCGVITPVAGKLLQ